MQVLSKKFKKQEVHTEPLASGGRKDTSVIFDLTENNLPTFVATNVAAHRSPFIGYATAAD